MPDYTKTLIAPAAFTGDADDLAAFPINTLDPSLQARLTTHWLFDFITPVGWSSGALPANGDDVPVPGAVDVSRPDKLALPSGFRGAVTVVDATSPRSKFEYASGRGGFKLPTGVYGGARINQVSVAAGNVGHPPSEAFKDFLVQGWIKPNGSVAFGSYFGCGNNNSGSDAFVFWGIGHNGAQVCEMSSNVAISGVIADQWAHLAASYRYDVGANKTYIRLFKNGYPITDEFENTTGFGPPSAQTANAHNATHCGFSNVYVPNANITVGRYRRDFTNIAGYEMDVVAAVLAEWNANKARIAGL